MNSFSANGNTYTNVELANIPTQYKLPAAKQFALSAINKACDRALNQLADTYPAAEVASFDKQEAEANALINDNNAPAPLLRAIAESRGISVVEIAQRVITKAELFASASGQLIGYRQSLEDAIDAAQSIEAVQKIKWERDSAE